MSRVTTLDALERETLSQAFRYRIAVAEEFAKLPAFSSTDRPAKNVLDALVAEHDYLRLVPLYGHRYCYQLAARFAQDFQSDFETSRPLKEIEKLKAYAMLRFCLAQKNTARQPLNVHDFEEHFPQQFYAVASNATNRPNFRNYYLAPPRLGFLRVDTGGAGSWKRIVLKCQRDLASHRAIPAYQELMEGGHFEYAVVTPFAAKARRVHDSISEPFQLQGIRLHVLEVPELIELIAPPPIESLSGFSIAPV